MHEREVLTCWKDIANFLGCGVRTAQRWERTLGLPVHRPANESRQIVAAFVDEIEAWRAGWGKAVGCAELINLSIQAQELDFSRLQAAIQQRVAAGNTAPIVIQFAQQPGDTTQQPGSRRISG